MRSSICIPCNLPYVNNIWLQRSRGDRPPVVPEGVTNLGLIGQYVELEQDIAFTFEYSTRTGLGGDSSAAQARARRRRPSIRDRSIRRAIWAALEVFLGSDVRPTARSSAPNAARSASPRAQRCPMPPPVESSDRRLRRHELPARPGEAGAPIWGAPTGAAEATWKSATPADKTRGGRRADVGSRRRPPARKPDAAPAEPRAKLARRRAPGAPRRRRMNAASRARLPARRRDRAKLGERDAAASAHAPGRRAGINGVRGLGMRNDDAVAMMAPERRADDRAAPPPSPHG